MSNDKEKIKPGQTGQSVVVCIQLSRYFLAVRVNPSSRLLSFETNEHALMCITYFYSFYFHYKKVDLFERNGMIWYTFLIS